MIQVVIVGDHPVACHGVAAMLSGFRDITVTMRLSSSSELADHAGDLPADVILFDLSLRSDQPCFADISLLRSSASVLVISASGRPSDVLGAIKAGACGYLTMQADMDTLVSAVRMVARGGFVLSADLAGILAAELVRSEAPAEDKPAMATDALSPREEQALHLIARGFTHAQAAHRMGVTKATFDTYVKRIRSKLQLGNKAELVRAAMLRAAGGEDQ